MLVSRNLTASLAAVLLAILVVSCASDDEPAGFVFTSVPHTVFAEAQCESISCSTSYYLSDTCAWNAADQVQVIIRAEARNAFVTWISDRHFVVAEEYNRTDDSTVYLLLAVPRGAVPDAITAISERPGVVFAAPNELVFATDAVPQFIQECRDELAEE